MKTIAIDAHMLGDFSGGNESHYINLINHIKNSDNVELIIFVQPEFDCSLITIPCRCVKFETKNPLIRNFVEIPRLVRKFKIDVLHMQYFIPFQRCCKTLVTIHDISFEHYKDIFLKKEYYVQKLLIPYAAKHADLIFTVSEYSKEDIAKTYKISPDKICVIYNGVSSSYCKLKIEDSDRKTILEKFGINSSFILCVGNLQPRKNIKRLLEAYKILRENCNDDIQLVIVGGRTWMFNDVFEEIQKENLQENVIFPKYIKEEDLNKLYNLAIFFVYPSFFEGFGLPVLEAMKCGVPIATSNNTSLPEVAGDGALLFNPFDANDIYMKMKELYNNSQLREELIKKADKQAQKFNWEWTAAEVMKQYIKE